jgi:hypothetical protein
MFASVRYCAAGRARASVERRKEMMLMPLNSQPVEPAYRVIVSSVIVSL